MTRSYQRLHSCELTVDATFLPSVSFQADVGRHLSQPPHGDCVCHQTPSSLSLSYFTLGKGLVPGQLPFTGTDPSFGSDDLMLTQRSPPYLAGFPLGLVCRLFLLGTTSKCRKAPRLNLVFRSLLYLYELFVVVLNHVCTFLTLLPPRGGVHVSSL